MSSQDKILIGKGTSPVYLLPRMASRHGLIAGADETEKTATLKVLAEAFSGMGVPVFLADTKGGLAGLAESFPVQFWDLFGQYGHPVRTTVSEMGSPLLSRVLGLNETQTGVLNIVFRIADEKGLLLLDLKDLRAMLRYIGENAGEFALTFGNISKQTVGAIQRNLTELENQDGELFFGEPQLDLTDWIKTAADGRGFINILHSTSLCRNPVLYSTFLLWLLSSLFETLPETEDSESPRFIFFFDEARLLFRDASTSLLDKIEQTVELAQRKGIGIFFLAETPSDLPPGILSRLGNRIQHSLRAYTPAEIRKAEAAADSFRSNPDFDTRAAITELVDREALVSCLDAEGRPGMVEKAFIRAPQCRLVTIDDAARNRIIESSALNGKYDRQTDRLSAFEQLQKIGRVETANKGRNYTRRRGHTRQTPLEKAANAVFSTIGREVGRTLIRGILGSLKK